MGLKEEIDNNKTRHDFNTLFSEMDKTSERVNKETLDLNHTLDQMNLTDTYRPFHLTITEYTFFSSVH